MLVRRKGMGAVLGSDGCWTIPWWCGDTILSTGLFSSCAIPTAAQINASSCNAGPALNQAQAAAVLADQPSAGAIAAAVDPSGAAEYNTAVDSPTIAALFGTSSVGQALNSFTGGGSNGVNDAPTTNYMMWIALGVGGLVVLDLFGGRR